MSFTNNTASLQSILDAVNALPEAGGVTVQKKSGTFTTNSSSGAATVNCGFKPDFIFFHHSESGDGYLYHAAAAIAEEARTGTISVSLYTNSDIYYLYDIGVAAISSGFEVEVTGLRYSDYTFVVPPATTFTYTAVKYTE